MKLYLYVGLGGAIGAMCRYGLSTITVKSSFPLMTFLTNLLGAIIIGLIMGISAGASLSSELMSLLKTGFCGGFTTFSTFSLETVTLLQNRQYGVGAAYALLSLICCIMGVTIGMALGSLLVKG